MQCSLGFLARRLFGKNLPQGLFRSFMGGAPLLHVRRLSRKLCQMFPPFGKLVQKPVLSGGRTLPLCEGFFPGPKQLPLLVKALLPLLLFGGQRPQIFRQPGMSRKVQFRTDALRHLRRQKKRLHGVRNGLLDGFPFFSQLIPGAF